MHYILIKLFLLKMISGAPCTERIDRRRIFRPNCTAVLPLCVSLSSSALTFDARPIAAQPVRHTYACVCGMCA
ncbi:hypothetical protein PUN28_000714 [Cardiocondyla obscurior]|uniref:Secreted protein n=1 Tax=Cardiocondyla obscurior TaxID=286306 RepID=A0AAW2H0P4_9HYME